MHAARKYNDSFPSEQHNRMELVVDNTKRGGQYEEKMVRVNGRLLPEYQATRIEAQRKAILENIQVQRRVDEALCIERFHRNNY